MSRHKHFASIQGLICIVLLFAGVAEALPTHLHSIISWQAAQTFEAPAEIRLKYLGNVDDPTRDNLNGSICEGAYDEDEDRNPLDGGSWSGFVRWGSHFWDPSGGPYGGKLESYEFNKDDENAFQRAEIVYGAESIYKSAKLLYRDDPEKAYYELGRVAHLLEDMATPAHVHLDLHLPEENPVVGDDSYEVYVRNKYNAHKDFKLEDRQQGREDFESDFPAADISPVDASTLSEFDPPHGVTVGEPMLFRLFNSMATKAAEWDSDDGVGTGGHGIGGGSLVYWDWEELWNEISDEDCDRIASTLMPEVLNHVAGLYKLFYDEVNPASNKDPFLYNPKVEPLSGTESTDFTFSVDYKDVDGDAPISGGARVYIDAQEHGMTLTDGAIADGTYSYTSQLGLGRCMYSFAFINEHGKATIDPAKGPRVHGEGDSVIEIYVDSTRISIDDLYLKYSRSGQLGQYTEIPITGEELEPLVVEIGEQVWFQAGVNSLNYEYVGWDSFDDGHQQGGTTNSWSIQTSDDGMELIVTYKFTPQPYTISGTVLRADGTPVPGGVVLTLTSPQDSLRQDTDDGSFSFTSVKGGVSVTITPSADGYAFSPASLVFNNLKSDQNVAIVAYSSDAYAPTASLVSVPPGVSEDSSVSFSWEGEDDRTLAGNLVYQYKLDGVDSGWSGWTSDTSKSYDLANGAYTFWVQAKDEGENVNQAPANYKFVVDAAPKVSSAIRVNRSVWASRITLVMPSTPSQPTNNFVLMPEHCGIADSELAPVTIHRVAEPTACGANEIVAGELGLTERITKATSGWLVTLPESIPAGQTAQYDIVWGKIKYFGWKEAVDVPLGFPNGGIVWSPYLDEDLRMWRVATKVKDRDSWVFMNVWNEHGSIVDETELRYAHGHDWQGSPETKEYRRLDDGHIHKIGRNVCYFWNDTKDVNYRTLPSPTYVRSGHAFFDYSSSFLTTGDSEYSEELVAWLSNKPIGYQMWVTGCTSGATDADPTNAWFEVHDSDGNVTVPRTIHYSIQKPDGSWFSRQTAALPIGSDVLLLFSPCWFTTNGNTREQIYYQVWNKLGQMVKDTTNFSPEVIPDSIEKDDEYTIQSALADKEGKVWISYTHWQRVTGSEPKYYYYVILDANGDIWKGPIQTSQARNFAYCDMGGYMWATEGGNVLILSSDDTTTVPARPSAYMPNQDVDALAADVDTSGYRLYDRWSPQLVHIDIAAGVNPASMELFDLNLWDNDLHPGNISLKKGETSVWSQSGQFTGHTTVDTSDVLGEGQNILTMTQDDFLGGQVLVSFPYTIAHGSDKNGDFVIADSEILDYIDLWADDKVGDSSLLDAIDLWAAGCYYYDPDDDSFKPCPHDSVLVADAPAAPGLTFAAIQRSDNSTTDAQQVSEKPLSSARDRSPDHREPLGAVLAEPSAATSVNSTTPMIMRERSEPEPKRESVKPSPHEVPDGGDDDSIGDLALTNVIRLWTSGQIPDSNMLDAIDLWAVRCRLDFDNPGASVGPKR